jgi:hypothetical protein
MNHPVIVTGIVVLVSILVAYFAWAAYAIQHGVTDQIRKVQANAERVQRERNEIHGPTYWICPRQQLLWAQPCVVRLGGGVNRGAGPRLPTSA